MATCRYLFARRQRESTASASFSERVGSLRTERHPARFVKGIRRACIPAAAVRRGFALHDHILVWLLPRYVEVDQRELPAFVRIFDYLGEVTSFTISLRSGSDSLGFKLIGKRDQPPFYFDVTGHKRKLAALLDFIA
jgi:hypothetical protein